MRCCTVAQREEGKDKDVVLCVEDSKGESQPSIQSRSSLPSFLALSLPSLLSNFLTLSHLTPSQSLSFNAATHNTAHHSLQYSTWHALTLNLSLTLTAWANTVLPACPLDYLPVLLLSTAARTVRTELLLHIIYTHNEYVKFLIPFYDNLDVLLEDRADTATEEKQPMQLQQQQCRQKQRHQQVCIYPTGWLTACLFKIQSCII